MTDNKLECITAESSLCYSYAPAGYPHTKTIIIFKLYCLSCIFIFINNLQIQKKNALTVLRYIVLQLEL